MEKFVRLIAKACPLDLANVDTDQILPARYLKMPRATRPRHRAVPRLALRRRRQPNARIFRSTSRSGATRKILIAGRNFGGGSSREAAVYALYDSGIRCVVAPSFGDIFAQNAVKNGLLTAIVAGGRCRRTGRCVAADPDRRSRVDLEQQTITCGNRSLRVRNRSGQPQSVAQRLGRCRVDRELPRSNIGFSE